jgi:hypothetical protein
MTSQQCPLQPVAEEGGGENEVAQPVNLVTNVAANATANLAANAAGHAPGNAQKTPPMLLVPNNRTLPVTLRENPLW